VGTVYIELSQVNCTSRMRFYIPLYFTVACTMQYAYHEWDMCAW